jgi:hypothetical protein
MWTAHRRDQFGGTIRELRCLGDTVASLVSVPAVIHQRVLPVDSGSPVRRKVGRRYVAGIPDKEAQMTQYPAQSTATTRAPLGGRTFKTFYDAVNALADELTAAGGEFLPAGSNHATPTVVRSSTARS